MICKNPSIHCVLCLFIKGLLSQSLLHRFLSITISQYRFTCIVHIMAFIASKNNNIDPNRVYDMQINTPSCTIRVYCLCNIWSYSNFNDTKHIA